MNVFHKFTRLSLKHNFTRTLVTVIGIVLSMALFTAVIQGAYSGIMFMSHIEEESNGRWHGFYYDMTEEDVQKVLEDPETAEAACWTNVGFAKVESEIEARPYMSLKSIGENFTDLLAIRILEGRMPETANEIVLPSGYRKNGKPIYRMGDVIKLEVGRRVVGENELHDHDSFDPDANEEIIDAVTKTYTVVGTYDDFSYPVVQRNAPAYIGITVGEEGANKNVFFRVKHPSGYYEYMNKHALSGKLASHSDLLMFSGSISNGGIANFIYGFAAILVFLIVFGSISLIYNSFSISVSERTKQFGILKSVGATSRQIRGTVLYEALLLSCIAIPIGIAVGLVGIGITLTCLSDSFSMIVNEVELASEVKMRLEIAPLGLLISVLVCVITALISAYIPARRAMSASAIESISQSRDVKVRARDVRTWGITKKLFGFEGMLASKNFGRAKKRYRSTVLSLFLSVTLFISASSFCSYFGDTVGGVASAYGVMGPDVSYSMDLIYEDDTVQKTYDMLSGADFVTAKSYYQNMYTLLAFDSDTLTDEFKGLKDEEEIRDKIDIYTDIKFLDDENFRLLCRENGIDENIYFDASAPKALALNTMLTQGSESDSIKEVKILKESSLPITGTASKLNGPEIDGPNGYVCAAMSDDKYYFVQEDYYDQLRDEGKDTGNIDLLDKDKTVVLSRDEAFDKLNFDIGAIITKNSVVYTDSYSLLLVYPYSIKDALLVREFGDFLNKVYMAFKSSDHAATYDSMQGLLTQSGMTVSGLVDIGKMYEAQRAIVDIVNVFSYGFIILISLIAVANVFNTISTNIMLRRREFAMLKSVGMTERGFKRMMSFECIRYGVKALLWGLPASFAMTYVMFMVSGSAYETSYYVPWSSVAIAVGSVFAVVFATMFYASGKIKKDNPIDALKNENI